MSLSDTKMYGIPWYWEHNIKEFIKRETELIELVIHKKKSWTMCWSKRRKLIGEKLNEL